MKLLEFETRKLFRSSGFVYLCVGMLILNMLFCIFSPPFAESEGYIESYESNISYVIRVAERNLLEYEATVGEENYIVRYQRDVIDRYTALLENGVKPEEVIGWNEFFDNNLDDLLPILAAVIAGVLLTMTEWDNGTHKLVNMTPKGRKSVRAKMAILAFFSLAAVILMTAVSLAGIVLRFGLSSPSVPLCSVEKFAYCPYGVSIFAYILITVPIKAVNLFLIALISALAASLAKSYLMGFLAPLGVVAVGYGISSVTLLNPYTAALCDPIFERYRSLDIFDRSVPLLTALCAMLILISAVLAILYAVSFASSMGGSTFAGIEKRFLSFFLKVNEKILSSIPRRAPKRHSLLYSEAKKSFIKSHLVLLCILMLGVKVWYTSSTAPDVHGAEEYYHDRCNELCGELTDEKRGRIDEKLAECAEIMSKAESMRLAMQSGSITGDEYSTYLDEYSRASIEQYAYMKLAEQRARIDAAASRGQEAYIIYDSGWNAYFESSSDVILSLFLLLFFCGIYDLEYKNGFDRIAETSARGMRALHKAKITLAVIVAVSAFIVFSAIDMISLLNSYTLPNAAFPLASITETAISMPLFGAMLIKYSVGMIASVLFSIVICLLSRFLKKVYIVIPVGVLIVLFITQ